MANEWEDAPTAWEDAPSTEEEGFFTKALGVGEGALSTATALGASIPGGLAGLGSLATGGGLEGANKALEDVSGALTYSPRTKTGKAVADSIGETLADYPQQYSDAFAKESAYLTKQKKMPGASDLAAENTEKLFGELLSGLYAPGIGGVISATRRAGKGKPQTSVIEDVQRRQAEIDAQKKAEAPKVEGGWEDAPTNETRQLELLEPDNQGKMANPYEAQHGTWAVDENGMPVRTDISMEAANLEQPLQRNLWGDELPPRETPVGQAADLPMDRDIMGQPKLTQPDVAPEQIGITQAMDNTKREGLMAENLEEAVSKMDQVNEQVQMLSHDLKADGLLERARMDAEINTPRSKATDPTIRTISPGGRQTGAVNPQMFKDTYEAIKKVGDYTMKLLGNEYGGPTVVLMDRAGKEIGELRTQGKYTGADRNLEADFVKVDHAHRGKGLAKEMYSFLAEQGNDIRRSDNLLDDGQKMWNKFEQQGFAKKGYIPLKQRGAVGNLSGNKKSRTVIDDLRDRFGKEKGEGPMIPENPDPKKVVADALDEGKDSKQWNLTESGATLAAMKRDSAAIEGAHRMVQNAQKKAEYAIREQVFPAETALRKLSNTEIATLGELMKSEMLNGARFDPKALETLSVRQQEAYAQVRHMFDDTLRIQNEARVAKGQEPITAMEAYLSSRWRGDFRRPVFEAILDKSGNPVIKEDGSIAKKLKWYLAADTKAGLEKQWAALKKLHPDLTFDPKEDHTVRFYKRQTDLQSSLNTILDIVGRDTEAGKLITEAAKQQSVNEAASFLGQEKHFKEKAGVRGFVGDRPDTRSTLRKKMGRDHSVNEAIGMFQQQIQYAKNAYKWSEMQKAGLDIKELVTDKDLIQQQPNNVKYIKEYFKQNIGYGEGTAIAHIEDAVRDLGMSPTLIDKAVGDVKSFFILQKLAANTGYTLANVVQTGNVLPHLAALRSNGIKGNPLTAIPIGIAGGIAMATGHYANFLNGGRLSKSIKTPEAHFLQKAFKYAEDNGVTSRSMYDESPIETSFSAVSKGANMLGKTMSVPEAFVRGMAYMTYVEFLRSSKKFKGDDIGLFQKAEELVNASMVDYRRGERPMMFEKLGTAGNFLNTLQTYPVNYYNQWNFMGREAMKGNVAPIATMLAVQYAVAGASGIPGFDDLTKLYDLVKDHVVSDKTYGKMRDSDFFTDPKMWMAKHLGQPSVYGWLSDKTGIGLTSRVSAPGAGAMLQSPVGPAVDIAKQVGNVASAAMDPTNTSKLAQVGMSSTPPGLQGLLETAPFMEGITWEQRGDKKLAMRPGAVTDHRAVVERDEGETSLRKWGLRSQREAIEREAGYRMEKQKSVDRDRSNSMTNAIYDAAKQGKKERVAELMEAYTKLNGAPMSEEAWNAQVEQNYFTSSERAAGSAKSIAALKDVARMNALMKEVRDAHNKRNR